MAQGPFRDVGIVIGILLDPPVRGVKFDGMVASFSDADYYFVSEKLGDFGPYHIPPWFWDCFGGASITGSALEELGWFADTLVGALADYPDHWDVDACGKPARVERERVRRELCQLGKIVRRAKSEGRTVVSWGD
jgi:hypothetical protein